MHIITPKYVLMASSLLAFALFSYQLVMDGLESGYNDYGYYLSESALFSIVWLLAIPIVIMIYKFEMYQLPFKQTIPLIVLLSFGHVLVYAVLVWLGSLVIFDHTYHILSNLQYGLLKYFLILVILYSALILFFKYFSGMNVTTQKELVSTPSENILVVDQNKKILIKSSEIIYIKANKPYIEIYTADKKYLEQNALKDIIQNLDQNTFIRVHKSSIINIGFVKNYTSRMNGDYDVEMQNGAAIRLSRNYAASFKALVINTTQLSIKSTQVDNSNL